MIVFYYYERNTSMNSKRIAMMGTKSTGEQPREQASGKNDVEVVGVAGMVAPTAPVSEAGTESAMRVRAISQVIAALVELRDARTAVDVRIATFRQNHLPGGRVLPPPAVFGWIVDAHATDGEPSPVLADVPWEALKPQQDGSYVLPADWAHALLHKQNVTPSVGGGFSVDNQNNDVTYSPRLVNRTLALIMPTTTSTTSSELPVRVWHVRPGGTLDEIRRIADELIDRISVWRNDPSVREIFQQHWAQARAATFLLTDYAPLVAEEQFPLPSGRGSRRQSTKHLQLAVFTAQHAGESIRSRMEQWNDTYAEWAYAQPTNFGWDSLQAIRRLLAGPNALTPTAPKPAPSIEAMTE
jgi:hypothetical protein